VETHVSLHLVLAAQCDGRERRREALSDGVGATQGARSSVEDASAIDVCKKGAKSASRGRASSSSSLYHAMRGCAKGGDGETRGLARRGGPILILIRVLDRGVRLASGGKGLEAGT
jgi:hypothetical protein